MATDLDGNDFTLGDLIGLAMVNEELANKLADEIIANLKSPITDSELPKGYRRLPKWRKP